MPIDLSELKQYLALALLAVSLGVIHYTLDRASIWLVPTYSLAFFVYLFLLKNVSLSIRNLFVIALGLRVFLFFSVPNLSDDFYRFLWDGELQHLGVNPYAQTPRELLGDQIAQIDEGLFQHLNSPDYRTVYPPLSQMIFKAATACGGSVFLKTNVLRLIILLYEFGVLFLLTQLLTRRKKSLFAVYALNPLVILELTGNLHFEGIVLFFLLLFTWFSATNGWLYAAGSLALGIMAKLTPLMFLPLLIKQNGLVKAVLQGLVILVVGLILTLPFLEASMLEGMSSSLGLFFQNFEFNAGLFFLFRAIGFWWVGYDPVQMIGPLMSVIAMVLIVGYSWWTYVPGRDTLPKAMLMIWSVQLLFATTVHPWYAVPLIGLAVCAGYAFPIVWSGCIFLSYFGYGASGYEHPFLLIAIEYFLVLAVAGFELIKNKPLLNHYLISDD